MAALAMVHVKFLALLHFVLIESPKNLRGPHWCVQARKGRWTGKQALNGPKVLYVDSGRVKFLGIGKVDPSSHPEPLANVPHHWRLDRIVVLDPGKPTVVPDGRNAHRCIRDPPMRVSHLRP